MQDYLNIDITGQLIDDNNITVNFGKFHSQSGAVVFTPGEIEMSADLINQSALIGTGHRDIRKAKEFIGKICNAITENPNFDLELFEIKVNGQKVNSKIDFLHTTLKKYKSWLQEKVLA